MFKEEPVQLGVKEEPVQPRVEEEPIQLRVAGVPIRCLLDEKPPENKAFRHTEKCHCQRLAQHAVEPASV